MKKNLILLLLTLTESTAFACDACKKQRTNFLLELGHGPGPDSRWDYVIVAVMTLITIYILIISVKLLLRPAEAGQDHIKRIILNDLEV